MFTPKDLAYKTQGTKLTRDFRNYIDEITNLQLYKLITYIVVDFRIFRKEDEKQSELFHNLGKLENELDKSSFIEKNMILLKEYDKYRISLYRYFGFMF